jgi:hypothetical protein
VGKRRLAAQSDARDLGRDRGASPEGAEHRARAVGVLHNGDGTDAIVIKGRAERVTERDELARVDQAYRAKYVDPHTGTSATMTTRTDWRAE